MLEQGSAGEEQLLETLELSLVSLKVLRRLIIAGFEHPSRSQEVQGFWVLTHSHFSKFHSLVDGSVNLSEPIHRAVEKHLLQMSKLHVEMAKTHPASFALLPDSISLVQSYWTLVIKLGEKYDSLGAGDGVGGRCWGCLGRCNGAPCFAAV